MLSQAEKNLICCCCNSGATKCLKVDAAQGAPVKYVKFYLCSECYKKVRKMSSQEILDKYFNKK